MFKLVKIINGRQNVPEPEYLPTTSGVTYKIGDALVITSGALVKATGTTRPTHISMKTLTGTGAEIPVARIEKNMVFEAPVTYSSTANTIVLGSKLTVSDNSTGVTDVTTDGVATVVDTLGANKKLGDKVLVIFE